MSTETQFEKEAVNGIRTTLGLAGALTLIAGILILVWPGQTAAVVTWILAIYVVAAGLVYAGLGIFSNLTATKLWLAVFVSVFIGIAWIIEGIVSLSTLSDAKSKGWTIFFAIVSVIAGLYLLFSPLWGAVVLWWLLGIMLIVMGILNIIRAFTFGKSA
jgi:uncharacterized membrane protein HdeD (DUF308 family)